MSRVRHRRVGTVDVFSLSDGRFRLDGGAMFGTVPRVLWERLSTPDDRNRISLRINPLLIRLPGLTVLVETGMDDKAGEKFESIYALERDTTVFDGLRELGLGPEDIDLVVNTHLHFDHAGRNTTLALEPAFPNARYVVQRQELDDALHPHDRNRASYHGHNVAPIHERGLFDIIDGPAELAAGLSVLPIPGHNLGQQAVVLESDGQALVYAADLLPTGNHAPYPYIMGYDLYPVTTLQTRQHHFPRWAEEGWIVCPPHDPDHSFGRLLPVERGGYAFAPLPE